MNEQQILAVLTQFGVSNLSNSLVGGVTALLAKNPSATDADLLSEDEGSLKHVIRGKIGFLVDLLWPDIQPYLDQAISAAIATARAQA